MPFSPHDPAIDTSLAWILGSFDVLIIGGLIAYRIWRDRDAKKNWVIVAKKDGVTYEQHKTLRKRRWFREEGRVNAKWVTFKTDEL